MAASRRTFLTGSSFFAAALCLASAASAQEKAKPDSPRPKPPKEQERRRGPKTDEEILAEQERARTVLIDEEGNEYLVCPQCGFKMYRQGRTWTCSNCGYSFVD